MRKQIIRDVILLSKKSVPATIDDLSVAQDLKDTLIGYNIDANRSAVQTMNCVGLSASQIGVFKRIIIALIDNVPVVMFNPEIIAHSKETFINEEGCLSFDHISQVERYRQIKVNYYDDHFKRKTKTLKGLNAIIVQHEMDYFEGKHI